MNHSDRNPAPWEDATVHLHSTVPLTNSKTVRVGRWLVTMPIRAEFSDLDIDGISTLSLVVDVLDDHPVTTSLSVTAINGAAIDGTALRGIPVRELCKQVVQSHLLREVDGEQGSFEPSDLSVDSEAVRAAGPTDESLRVVADIYEVARLLGDPPAREVEKALDMPRTTASKWIRRARERGILETSPARPDLVSR